MGDAVINAKLDASFDDLGFRHMNERRLYLDVDIALDTGFCRQIRHPLKSGYILRAAIGVSAVVDGVDADKDI
jgi:hypothetical protein